ncbi:MAG: TetR/AcrR family transcriptional regulator [Pseudomonadota bacterium]
MAQKPPRARAVQAMKQVFAQHGYEGASLTALGKAGGLSKAGLYHHFPGGKADMASQVLVASGKDFTRLVLAPLRSKDPAAERLYAMLDGLNTYYQSGTINCLMNTLALGEGLPAFGPNIKAAISAWLAALTPTLEELGEADGAHAARTLVATVHGALIQTRLFDDPGFFTEMLTTYRRRYR